MSGKELGKGGAKRHKKVLHDSIQGIAEQHFKQNKPEGDLLKILTQGCYYLGATVSNGIQGPCLSLVYANIDTLYGDFQSGMNAWTLCIQQKLCTAADNSTLLASLV
uniref:Histone H4 n=1 Tax=Rhabditophanes sp. KR3021 TaxID=114890 RepID=A0AC35UEE0_9BILA